MDDDQFLFAYRNVRLNDENRIPPGDLRFLVDEFVEEVETMPKLLILDYLGYWARSFKGSSRYEQVSDAIMELKALAKEFGVAIVVPHQVSRVGKRGQRLELDFARDSGVVEETADFAFSLWSPHTQEERDDAETGILQRADVRIEILKSRHGGVGRETKMLWAPASLALPPAAEPALKKMVLHEYEWVDQGKLYEQVHKLHRSGYG
jgi:replicative DNA helicase